MIFFLQYVYSQALNVNPEAELKESDNYEALEDETNVALANTDLAFALAQTELALVKAENLLANAEALAEIQTRLAKSESNLALAKAESKLASANAESELALAKAEGEVVVLVGKFLNSEKSRMRCEGLLNSKGVLEWFLVLAGLEFSCETIAEMVGRKEPPVERFSLELYTIFEKCGVDSAERGRNLYEDV